MKNILFILFLFLLTLPAFASNELIQQHYNNTDTLYATVRQFDTGNILRISILQFEAFGTGSRTLDDYDITATGSGGSWYKASMPAISAGTYYIQFFVKLGTNPTNTDTPLPIYKFQWDGVYEVKEGGDRRTWYVSSVAGDDTNNIGHSSFDPLKTINAAITKSSSGDTIYVYSGTYNESVDFNAVSKSIKLIGYNEEGKYNVIISPTSVPATAITLYDNCHLENLNIIGNATGDYRGISAVNKTGLKIINCYVSGMSTTAGPNGVDGARFDYCTDVFIDKSTFASAWDGLTFYGTVKNDLVKNSYIYSNGTTSTDSRALYTNLSAGSSLIVENCQIIINDISNNNINIQAVWSSNTILSKCNIVSNKTGVTYSKNSYAIFASGDTLIDNCNIYSYTQSGTSYDIDASDATVRINNSNYSTTHVSGTGIIKEYLRPTTFARTINLNPDGTSKDANTLAIKTQTDKFSFAGSSPYYVKSVDPNGVGPATWPQINWIEYLLPTVPAGTTGGLPKTIKGNRVQAGP